MFLGHVGNHGSENACVDTGCLGRDDVCSLMEVFEKMSTFCYHILLLAMCIFKVGTWKRLDKLCELACNCELKERKTWHVKQQHKHPN